MLPESFRLIMLFVFLPIFAMAQKMETVPRAAQKAFERAEESMQEGNLLEAEKHYLKSLDEFPDLTTAKIRLGALYFDQGKDEKSKDYFTQVIQDKPDQYPLIYFKLGEIAWRGDDFTSVESHMNQYLGYNDGSAELRLKAAKLARDASFIKKSDQARSVSVKRLPPTINSAELEYLPSLPASGAFMVFTRRVRGQEDFFISQKVDDGWSQAIPISDLNTVENEGAHCVSADGKMLIFTACARRDGLGSCDLYFSVNNEGKWSKPRNMGQEINTSGWEGQPSLSSNGISLYFSSDRKQGMGGRDLWRADRSAKGWGQPVNLSSINTSGNEEAPFIHSDNQTLYFMSDGHPGFGGSDLFVSRLERDLWQVPVNLGRPLNTSENEGAIFVDILGHTGYFARTSSTLKEAPDIDIYSFPVPEDLRPTPVTYAMISVTDALTKKPLQSIVQVYDIGKRETFVKTWTDEKGEILICLTSEKSFAINIEKEEYTFYSENINLEGYNTETDPYVVSVSLNRIPSDEQHVDSVTFVLNNIFFESGSATLKNESDHELRQLHKLLSNHPDMNIEIHGHTDDVGEEDDNQTLSLARAAAIQTYLESKGIAIDRMKCKGFGELNPVATNGDEVGRKKNRRTEFIITKR